MRQATLILARMVTTMENASDARAGQRLFINDSTVGIKVVKRSSFERTKQCPLQERKKGLIHRPGTSLLWLAEPCFPGYPVNEYEKRKAAPHEACLSLLKRNDGLSFFDFLLNPRRPNRPAPRSQMAPGRGTAFA